MLGKAHPKLEALLEEVLGGPFTYANIRPAGMHCPVITV